MKKSFKVEKLIRDGMQDHLKAKNINVFQEVIEHPLYIEKLGDKLVEESFEVARAVSHEERKEELADLLEVVSALCTACDYALEDIVALQKKKREERGGFQQKVYCSHMEMDSDNPCISYYTQRPEEYPEILPEPSA